MLLFELSYSKLINSRGNMHKNNWATLGRLGYKIKINYIYSTAKYKQNKAQLHARKSNKRQNKKEKNETTIYGITVMETCEMWSSVHFFLSLYISSLQATKWCKEEDSI